MISSPLTQMETTTQLRQNSNLNATILQIVIGKDDRLTEIIGIQMTS